jgi:hypothetical protein
VGNNFYYDKKSEAESSRLLLEDGNVNRGTYHEVNSYMLTHSVFNISDPSNELYENRLKIIKANSID